MAAIFQLRRGSGSVETLMDGELYVNKGPDSLQYSIDERKITLAKLDELNTGSLYLDGMISASGDISASNLYVSGNVTIGGNITIGDQTTDSITINADLDSDLIPNINKAYDLGKDSTLPNGDDGKWYDNLYVETISSSFISGAINGIGNVEEFSTSVDSRLDYLEGPFSTSVDSRMDLLEAAMSGSNRLYVSPEGTDTTGSVPHGTQHNPYKTIKAAVESLGEAVFTNINRTTIFIGSGNYTEQNPIAVPPGVAIVGDTLRTVRLTAANPTQDFFHVHDSNYFYGLRFLDLQHPAFCFSYPSSTATSTINGGSVDTINIDYSVSGYTDGINQDLGIIIEGPDNGGIIATATADVVDGVITQINVVDGGTTYLPTEKPHISIPAPVAKRPVITTSPYIQNCSSITGPFNTSGVKVLQALPYDEATFNIDEQGAGGGIRIDGNLVHPLSPLESFVADAFTQVNQGGPGHLVINKGYAQFVSCFTTFCTYGFKTANGGFANVSNSVIDFGKYGLISKTYFPTSYNTATSSVDLTSYLAAIQLDENGAGYTGSVAGVTIFGGGATIQAVATASVDANGSIREIIITNSGSGYTSKPTVEIDIPTGPGAIPATALFDKGEISNIGQIPVKVTDIARGIDISSNMVLDGQNYLVVDVSGSGEDRLISILNTEFHPAPASITSGSILNFHQLSNISTGNIVMEYVGSGITYNALPKFGGIPLRTREVNEFAPGRVFYTSVDNIGNLKIGDYFSVNQLTGEVSITSDSFNLTGLNAIGPFRRNGFDAGVILQEVSNNTTLLNSIGLHGEDTVPTQFAVKGYIDIRDEKLNKLEQTSASLNQFTASANIRLNNLETTSASHDNRITDLELASSSVSSSVLNLNLYTASLKTAIGVSGQDVTVLGNLTVNGTTTQINSTQVNIGDNILELNFGGSATEAGIYTKDATGASTTSGSLLWDSTTDYWKAGVLGNESKILLAGGDGVLSGSTDFFEFSTSVDSRLTNLQLKSASVDISISNINSTTASLSSSVSNLNGATASLYTSASLMTSSISSLTSSVVALQAFSGNVNTRFSRLQDYTTSVDSRLAILGAYTSSVEARLTEIGVVSGSLISSASAVSNSVWHLHQFSSSQLEKDSNLGTYTGSVETRFTEIGIVSSSLIISASAVSSSVWNLNAFSASINFFSSSIFTDFSNSYDAVSESFDYRISILDPDNLSASFAEIHTFTASATIRLNNIELYTSSISDDMFEEVASSTHTLVSGSSQIIDILIPLNASSASLNTFSSSALIKLANLESTSASINAWSSSLTTIFATDAEVAAGYEAQGRAIHSGSVGNYQFNSIGVGTAASTTAGEIRATGDITAFYSSDIRLKENITTIPNALEKVNQISGNTYDWKEGFEDIHSHKGNDVGVIAQEIENILPQIVTNRDNGFKAVQYEKIIPLLIEAVKELSAKVDRLENK